MSHALGDGAARASAPNMRLSLALISGWERVKLETSRPTSTLDVFGTTLPKLERFESSCPPRGLVNVASPIPLCPGKNECMRGPVNFGDMYVCRALSCLHLGSPPTLLYVHLYRVLEFVRLETAGSSTSTNRPRVPKYVRM